MIDKARVEYRRESAQRKLTAVTLPKQFAIDLMTDYLALRAIVEALAASDPLECDAARTELWYCPLCSGESALDSDAFRHAEDCVFARAVALVGPAGEREEGE